MSPSHNNQTHTYSFLDFELIPHQRLLLKNKIPVNLSKKSHDILLFLLQSAGSVVEKDQMINQIWPNQVVTDAALNKQITRLRQILSGQDSTPLIETVRGVGFMFTPDVTTSPFTPDAKPMWAKYLWFAAAAVLIWVLFSAYQKPAQQADEFDFADLKTINLAISPGIKTNDWLNVGGINHLANQLLEYQTIQAIKPEFDWFNRTDTDVLSIELSELPGLQYVLMVDNQQNAGQYTADLLLRSKQAIVAKAAIEADSANLLLEKIEDWTITQLGISGELIQNKKQHTPVVSDFVLENYLRGLAAAETRQYTDAAKLLQNAIDHDADFYPAWLALAEIEAELGQFDRSLALVNTLLNSGKLSDQLRLKIAPIKAKSLIYLNQINEAQALIDQSNQSAEQIQDINTLMKNLHNQALLNDYQGSLGLTDLTNFKKLLQMTQQFSPSSNNLGSVLHSLGVTYRMTGDDDQATEMINQAIEHFKVGGNAEGLVSSYRVLANILAAQDQHGEALLSLAKAEGWLDQVDGARALAHFWMAKANSQYATGESEAAKASIDELYQMSVTYATLQPKVKGLIIAAEMNLSYQNIPAARVVVDELLGIVTQNPDEYPTDAPYAVELDLLTWVLAGNTETAKQKRQQYLTAYPMLEDYLALELQHIEAHILAAEGFTNQAIEAFEQLEKAHLADNDVAYANRMAVDVLDLLAATDDNKKSMVLDKIERRHHFPYPVSLHKARLLARQNKIIPAITTLLELKAQAKDFWTPQDQLYLEQLQQQNNRSD